jgi:hypothetical protein
LSKVGLDSSILIVHALNTKRSFYPEKSHVKRAASVLFRAVGAEGGGGGGPPRSWQINLRYLNQKADDAHCPSHYYVLALPLRFSDLPAAM